LPERDRRDGPSDVRTDAGKLLKLGGAGGEATSEFPNDTAGRLAQVVGPGVVARSLPHLEDSVEGGARESVDRGERGHEPFEVRSGLGDAGLLKQDLCDPDAVRVAVAPPRQRSAVAAIPAK
jgi:hypothetical protein